MTNSVSFLLRACFKGLFLPIFLLGCLSVIHSSLYIFCVSNSFDYMHCRYLFLLWLAFYSVKGILCFTDFLNLMYLIAQIFLNG